MDKARLEWHLENWADFMRVDQNRLGYPRRSLMIASGGSSTADAFEIMCEEVDVKCAEQIDALIDSLRPPQRVAINHHWLKVKHCYPTQEYDLEMAYVALTAMAEKRGIV